MSAQRRHSMQTSAYSWATNSNLNHDLWQYWWPFKLKTDIFATNFGFIHLINFLVGSPCGMDRQANK